MIRSHKIRLNPTPEQETYLRKATGTARYVYNYGLYRWKEAKREGLAEFGVMAIKKELNAIKEEAFPWMYEVTKSVVESALANLGKALKNYFDSKNGKRQGKKVGFPNPKKKRSKKQSFGLANDRFKVNGHDLLIQKCAGAINMAESLRFAGKIMGAVVSRLADHWFIAIQVEVEKPVAKTFAKATVGVDVGIKSLAVLSDGSEFENQKPLRSGLNKLRKLNRSLSRRQQGSNRWWKAKQKLAQFHYKVDCKRSDAHHKTSHAIAATYALIGVEDLNVDGMKRNRKLSLSVSDTGLGEFLRQIRYKSDWFGGVVQKVGRFFASSKTCHQCGHYYQELTLSERSWRCAGCGCSNQRDWNASKNIEAEALKLAYA